MHEAPKKQWCVRVLAVFPLHTWVALLSGCVPGVFLPGLCLVFPCVSSLVLNAVYSAIPSYGVVHLLFNLHSNFAGHAGDWRQGLPHAKRV